MAAPSSYELSLEALKAIKPLKPEDYSHSGRHYCVTCGIEPGVYNHEYYILSQNIVPAHITHNRGAARYNARVTGGAWTSHKTRAEAVARFEKSRKEMEKLRASQTATLASASAPTSQAVPTRAATPAPSQTRQASPTKQPSALGGTNSSGIYYNRADDLFYSSEAVRQVCEMTEADYEARMPKSPRASQARTPVISPASPTLRATPGTQAPGISSGLGLHGIETAQVPASPLATRTPSRVLSPKLEPRTPNLRHANFEGHRAQSTPQVNQGAPEGAGEIERPQVFTIIRDLDGVCGEEYVVDGGLTAQLQKLEQTTCADVGYPPRLGSATYFYFRAHGFTAGLAHYLYDTFYDLTTTSSLDFALKLSSKGLPLTRALYIFKLMAKDEKKRRAGTPGSFTSV